MGKMIKCNLSRMMGERKLKISDLARETNINRGTLTRMYHETAERLELDVLSSLCQYFKCSIAEILEFVPDQTNPRNNCPD